jgi:hypothetical protein
MKNSIKRVSLGALLASFVFASSGYAADASKDKEKEMARQKEIQTGTPSATLDFESKQFRLILGGQKGKGVLHYKGKDYPFTLKGASVGGLGYSEVDAKGRVHFLNKLEDFAGTYGAATIGATAGSAGKGGSSWQNQKEVVLVLTSKQEGLALNLGFSAIEITLDK